jgi:diaminopimelate epimerase
MRLLKYHGLGNDFLLLLDGDARQPVDAALVRAVCDRHRGVGADGFIRVTGGGGTGGDSGVAMELYNADGGRAETSGNGLRCVARAVLDHDLLAPAPPVIDTDAGPRRFWAHDDGRITVEMSPAVYGAVRMGDGVYVNLGNPHLVLEVDDPAKLDLVEEAAAHPDVNVEFVARGPGPDELTMRVWERGVGETLSCGSGACAAVIAAGLDGAVGSRVTVHQPGGDLEVEVDDGSVLLTGPAEYVCEVEWPGEPTWR